jgi:hypothetical protein
MSTEDAHACWAAADRLACAAKAAGYPRPIGVLRAEAVRDRILGQDADPDRPPVVAELTVMAPLDALEDPCGRMPDAHGTDLDPTGRRQPVGEVSGHPITATHLRRLLTRLDALCPGGLQAPTGGGLRIALTDPDGALRAVLTRPQLAGLARSGCGAHPTDADCGCGLVDRPPDVNRYRPSAAQYQFVRIRDGRCRMPGCTARVAWADLDHVVPHAADGTTSCDNLCCLCRRHHRLKTFGRGWSFRMEADGTLVVTSSSAITRISRPPGMLTVGPPGQRGSGRGPAPLEPAAPAPVPPRHESVADPPPF